MEKDYTLIKERLERHFNSFYNQDDAWHFFLGLADYTRYVDENKATENIITEVLNKKLDDFRKYNELEKAVLEELEQSKNKLLGIIKKNKIDYDSLNKELNDLKAFEENRLHGYSKPEMFIDCIFDIARNLVENKHGNLLDPFVDNKQEPKNIYGNFVFSKSIELLRKEKDTLDYKEKTELWSAWNNLALAYIVIFKGEERLDELREKDGSSWEFFNFLLLVGEMRKIEESTKRTFSDFRPVQFKMEDYKQYALRIHNYLLDMLITKEENIFANIKEQATFRKIDKIKHISVVKGNTRDGNRIAINNNYIDSFEILSSTSKNIKSLMNAILDSTDILKNIDDFETCKSYLNSNSNCRIYKNRTGKKQLYAITPIVGFKNSLASNKELAILSHIKTDVITFNKYKRLLSQQENRNKTSKT